MWCDGGHDGEKTSRLVYLHGSVPEKSIFRSCEWLRAWLHREFGTLLTFPQLTVQFSTFILVRGPFFEDGMHLRETNWSLQILHYSRVMPTPDGHRYLPSTAVFLVELLKLTICLTISLYELAASSPRSTSATSLLSNLGGAIFAGDSWKMALPAGLYTLANSLQYVGISNLDAATFQV
jgi:hypothetical protein